MRTIFEYRYRDAGNFKAFGSIALEGSLTPREENEVRSKLEAGDYFIAEQVGVPPLYDQLYQWSDGPTASDHCWHEFVGFREATEIEKDGGGILTATELLARFMSIAQWSEGLSPHFDLTGAGRSERKCYRVHRQ